MVLEIVPLVRVTAAAVRGLAPKAKVPPETAKVLDAWVAVNVTVCESIVTVSLAPGKSTPTVQEAEQAPPHVVPIFQFPVAASLKAAAKAGEGKEKMQTKAAAASKQPIIGPRPFVLCFIPLF